MRRLTLLAAVLLFVGAGCTNQERPTIPSHGWFYIYRGEPRERGEEKIGMFVRTDIYHDGAFVRSDPRYLIPLRSDGRRTSIGNKWLNPCIAPSDRLSPSGKEVLTVTCVGDSRTWRLGAASGRVITLGRNRIVREIAWVTDDRLVMLVADARHCALPAHATLSTYVVTVDTRGREVAHGDCADEAITGPNGTIAENRSFDQNGREKLMFRRLGSGSWTPGWAATFDASGNLYVWDLSGRQLLRSEQGSLVARDVYNADWAR